MPASVMVEVEPVPSLYKNYRMWDYLKGHVIGYDCVNFVTLNLNDNCFYQGSLGTCEIEIREALKNCWTVIFTSISLTYHRLLHERSPHSPHTPASVQFWNKLCQFSAPL